MTKRFEKCHKCGKVLQKDQMVSAEQNRKAVEMIGLNYGGTACAGCSKQLGQKAEEWNETLTRNIDNTKGQINMGLIRYGGEDGAY